MDRKLRIQAKKDMLESNKKESPVPTSKRPPHNHYYKGCEKFYNRKQTSSLQVLMKEIRSQEKEVQSPGGVSTPVKPPRTDPDSPLSPSAMDVDTPLAIR